MPDNPRTDPQDRAWFGPHDRLFTDEESIPIDFVPGPEYGKYCILDISMLFAKALPVWCWGWDGAGDLDGPDVDPIWEHMPNKSISADAVRVRHDRRMNLL